MKTFYFLLTFLFSSVSLTAQQFRTDFYFTDTLGNQDTVTMGFDPDATIDVDAIFGEVDMKEVPFGEELEMRVGQIYDDNLGCFPGFSDFDNIDSDESEVIVTIGKKEFSGLSCNNGVLEYINSGRTTFFFKNSALPMKMTWDSLVFTSTCINQTIITDWHPNLWFDVTCGNDSLFYLEIGEITELWINEPTNVQIIDRSGDTLSMFHFAWDGDFTSSTKEQELPTFKSFPNPAQDELTIQFSEAKNRSWELVNINGKMMKAGGFTMATETLQLNQIPVGVYFLRVEEFQMERIVVGINY